MMDAGDAMYHINDLGFQPWFPQQEHKYYHMFMRAHDHARYYTSFPHGLGVGVWHNIHPSLVTLYIHEYSINICLCYAWLIS